MRKALCLLSLSVFISTNAFASVGQFMREQLTIAESKAEKESLSRNKADSSLAYRSAAKDRLIFVDVGFAFKGRAPRNVDCYIYSEKGGDEHELELSAVLEGLNCPAVTSDY